MNVWLLHVGEELKLSATMRLYRYGYLANALVARGHQVLRWAPTFLHSQKIHQFTSDTRVTVRDGYDIQFVHAPGYHRNVSFARLRSYRALAKRFRQLASTRELPDVIVSGIPSLDWCQAANEFGAKNDVPTVVDIRDLWPDIFSTALPSGLRFAGEVAFGPLHRQARGICQSATALTAVSQRYLEWGLRHARRSAGALDGVIPLGYQQVTLASNERADQLDWLARHGVDPGKTLCMYAGLFEKSYDLPSIMRSARRLHAEGRQDIQFVLCGDGRQSDEIRKQASKLPNVAVLGWVEQSTIATLMSISDIGLATYSPTATQSLPNKPFEYMAGGLAIASSLTGELADLLAANDCGVTYSAEDPAGLYDALVELTNDRESLAARRNRARQLYVSQFQASAMADRFSIQLERIRQAIGSCRAMIA